MVELRGELRLGLLETYSRPQAAHHFDPIAILVEKSLPCLIPRVPRKQRCGVQRNKDIRRLSRIHTKKPGRTYAGDDERRVVDDNGLPHRAWAGRETPL